MVELPLSERVAGKILAARARDRGESPFVHFGSRWRSFAEMHRRANRVGHALRGRGIRARSRVAILLRNRLECLDLWFALSRLGALQMPINCEYKAPQILQTLRRSTVDLIVVESGLLPQLSAALALMSSAPDIWVIDAEVEEWLAFPDDDIASSTAVDGADAGVIMNTSGTSGASKGVILSHAQQYLLGRNIANDMELSPDDVYYNFFPLFHNTAQAMITMPVLLTGGRMVLTERFSASRFWMDVRTHGCTAFYYIGEILRILLKSPPTPESTNASLRVAWGIGASAADFSEFQSRFRVRLRTGYGSTEANVPCMLPREGGKPGSAGCAIPGFEIRIADDGEILVSSSEPCALMFGYDADAAATAAAWRDRWFRTGDSGYLEEGQLFFTGRLKDAMRVRGENVSAFEVEETIAALDGVLEVAAIAVPAEIGGDDVKVVIVASPGVQLKPEAVIEWARGRLPRFAVPRYVEFVAELPKTPTNKVQKHVLRERGLNVHTWDGEAKCSV